MKTYLIIFIGLVLSACAPSGGGGSGGSGGGSAVSAPTESKSCAGTLQRGWVSQSTHFAHEFNSNCTGRVPSCDANFTYEIVEIDSSGGTFNITSMTSNAYTGCPVNGETGSCTFDYDIDHGVRRGMWVRCGSYPVKYYSNSYGTD